MNRFVVTIALVATLVLAAPGMASAVGPTRTNDASVLAKVLDAVFIRPPSVVAGIAASVFGAALLPIAWPAGMAEEVIDDTMGASWRFAIKRPLGVFSD